MKIANPASSSDKPNTTIMVNSGSWLSEEDTEVVEAIVVVDTLSTVFSLVEVRSKLVPRSLVFMLPFT